MVGELFEIVLPKTAAVLAELVEGAEPGDCCSTGDHVRATSNGTAKGYASSGMRKPGLKPVLSTRRLTFGVVFAPPP